MNIDKVKLEVDAIPRIFLQPNFNLSDNETFNAVYHVSSSEPPSGTSSNCMVTSIASGKLLQEQVSS